MKKSLLIVGVLLLVAIGLVVYGSTQVPEPTFKGKLVDILPPAPPGWTMVKREIADTPEMKEAVGELLNYDDGVFVDYSNGKDRLSVYIAYWKPGKMSHRLVAGHTPDVCWVGNGWKKEHSETVTGLSTGNGREIAPAEGRLFTANGKGEYVWFWHLVGQEAKSYASGYAPPWYAPLKDLFEKGLQQRQEQFFIRLSSGESMSSMSLQPILPLIVGRLPFPQVNQLESRLNQ
jgi:hypothetical protein